MGEWDNFYDDSEALEVLKRYRAMITRNNKDFFDLSEYESIIEYFVEQYNYKDAIHAVCHAMKQFPGISCLKLRYAQLLIETCKPAKALSVLKPIEEEESKNFEMHLAKGIALNLTGKNIEAGTSFEKALKYCWDCKDEVAYDIAQSFMQLGLNPTAQKYLLIAHHFNPNNFLVLYDLALNYERLDEPWESISYYTKYLELDPFAEHVWNNLGILYTSMEEYGKAEESFDFSIAIDPYYYSAYYDKADMLMKSENICKAIAVYDELLSVDALNTKALCEAGNCYQQIGDYCSALDVYWKALEIAPDCSDAWYGIGVVNFRQKRYLQSIGILKKAISLQPANADYWYILGESYYGAHRFNKAIEAYIRASELNPYDYNILTACAQALFRKHRIAEAKIMLTKLHQFNREDPLINYRLAACHAYLGELTKAQYYFKKGLSLNFHEHNEMFKLYPKTKTLPVFRRILDNYLLHMELFNKSRN